VPGVRDRNLRSGDLHEELGLFLLRAVALVAPVPRQEDVGNDAFATLIRPEGSRRLLPDVSFLVQLKASSVSVVSYRGRDEIAWITNLEIPLFIGRVDLSRASIALYSTQRLHQILLETSYDELHLLLDPADESSRVNNIRPFNVGPPVHTWSVADLDQPNFLTRTFSILRPHVEGLRTNRHLRDIRYQRLLKWETGVPPEDAGVMMMGTVNDDGTAILQSMVPGIQRLLSEVMHKKRYRHFPLLLAMIQMMREWNVDPDPQGIWVQMAAVMAQGPDLTDEDVVRLRCFANLNPLDLSRLQLSDDSLTEIPESVTKLGIMDTPISDVGIGHLLRLKNLSRLNVAGTRITDAGLDLLASLGSLEWLNVGRTNVTDEGIERLKARRPGIEVIR
jgi:hypothetical protein